MGNKIFEIKVRWKNNGIDPNDLKPYLEDFGERFFKEIIRLVENAVKEEEFNNKISQDTYQKLGIISNEDNDSNKKNEEIQRLNDLTSELIPHAVQYKSEISKFFGRDEITIKVI